MDKIKKFALPFLCVLIVVSSVINYFNDRNGEISVIYSDSSEAAYGEIKAPDYGSKAEYPEEATEEELQNENSSEPAAKGEADKTGKINLNTADSALLQTVKGIGPKKAEAIIKYRTDYGGFSCVDELTEVSGIGEKTLEKIRDYFYVDN